MELQVFGMHHCRKIDKKAKKKLLLGVKNCRILSLTASFRTLTLSELLLPIVGGSNTIIELSHNTLYGYATCFVSE